MHFYIYNAAKIDLGLIMLSGLSSVTLSLMQEWPTEVWLSLRYFPFNYIVLSWVYIGGLGSHLLRDLIM